MRKEVKIGIIFLGVTVLLIWGLNFLKGSNLLNHDQEFCGVFENVSGLDVSSDVTVNGLRIGRVSDIRFLDSDPNKLLVTISIQKDYYLPSNSTIQIFSKDLLGTKAINLLRGDSPKKATPGDTLSTGLQADLISSAVDLIAPLRQKAEEMMLSIDSVMESLQDILNPETRQHLRSSVATLDQILSEEKSKLSAILSHFESVSANLEKNNQSITRISGNLEIFSGQLAESDIKQAIGRTNTTLLQAEGLLTGLRNGEGSLGQLMVNDTLYNNLQSSLASLDSLLIDLRKQPKRYVHFSLFGRKDK